MRSHPSVDDDVVAAGRAAAPAPARALRVPFGQPWITADERRAVLDVLTRPTLTNGPEMQGFEREFAAFMGDEAHCVAVSSGMAALQLAARHCGLGPGDEVIVPAQTHTATAHAVAWTGATPVFVDCAADSGNMSPESIAAAVTDRTRAIFVVHFVGIPCAMPAIMGLAARHRLTVVEDCALAVGSRIGGRHVGLFGDAGCFSFFPAKHLATGEGGMFVSRSKDIADEARRTRSFGVDRSIAPADAPWSYDVTTLGVNYRMDELSAALGRAQLRRIDEMLARRHDNFHTLLNALAASPLRPLASSSPGHETSHYCLSGVLGPDLVPRRNAIAGAVNTAGFGTSVYYPHPVPRLQYYRQRYGWDAQRYPNATLISDGSIAFPVGPCVSPADVRAMADAILSALDAMAGPRVPTGGTRPCV